MVFQRDDTEGEEDDVSEDDNDELLEGWEDAGEQLPYLQ